MIPTDFIRPLHHLGQTPPRPQGCQSFSNHLLFSGRIRPVASDFSLDNLTGLRSKWHRNEWGNFPLQPAQGIFTGVGRTPSSIRWDVPVLCTSVWQMLCYVDRCHPRLGVDLLTDMFHYSLKYESLLLPSGNTDGAEVQHANLLNLATPVRRRIQRRELFANAL